MGVERPSAVGISTPSAIDPVGYFWGFRSVFAEPLGGGALVARALRLARLMQRVRA